MTATLVEAPGLVLPRWGTPRNPDRETRGGEVAEVAKRLGQPFLPWQRHVMDVALEVDPDTGRLWYSEIDLSIMRQCGKTMGWLFPYLVWRMTIVPHRLGRQRAAFTMQDRAKARDKLERDMAPLLRERTDEVCGYRQGFVEIENPKGRPGKPTRQWKLGLNNGSEHLLFGRGNYLTIETPSEKAGHSSTLDAAGIDEARFHQDDSVEQGVVPTMATREDAQLIVTSTAGNYKSVYLWPKVVAGRAAVDAGLDTRTAFFEYSVPETADLDDPAVWIAHHPALFHTIDLAFIFDKLEKARRAPDAERAEDAVRNEYANQWMTVPVLGDGERPLIVELELWDRRVFKSAPVGSIGLGVDVGPNGESASITLAGRVDGVRARLDVLACEAGTFWLEQRLREMIAEHHPVAVGYDAGNPGVKALAPEIGRACGDVPQVKLTGSEWQAACEAWRLGVEEGRYGHRAQVWLTGALVGAARKQRGAGWMLDRQTTLSDVTPLGAGIAALRAMETNLPPPPRRSAYEDAGLMTV